MVELYIVFLTLILGFVFTYTITQPLIRTLKGKRIVGVDGHKPDKPEVPEMGGLSILIGVTFAVILSFAVVAWTSGSFDLRLVAAVMSVFMGAGLIGAVDDLKKLNHHVKPLLLLLSATPMILLSAGVPEIDFSLFTLDFTDILGLNLVWAYWLVVVPLGVTGAANVVNMMAGFNGLMSSQAAVSSAAMAGISLIAGHTELALLFSAMVGAQLAFLRFNWNPARIFPGDVGTLSYGAFFAAAIIAGNMEFAGFIVLAPLLLNGSMSLLSVGSFFEEKQFRKEKLSALRVGDDGLISFTRLQKPITVCKLFLYNRPQTEPALVIKVTSLSIISSILALLLFWR